MKWDSGRAIRRFGSGSRCVVTRHVKVSGAVIAIDLLASAIDYFIKGANQDTRGVQPMGTDMIVA
jgi:hypothetical protein